MTEQHIACETCPEARKKKDAPVECEFCYNKAYCSAQCREQDWSQHYVECNTLVAASADADMGMVPSAYEGKLSLTIDLMLPLNGANAPFKGTAGERAWKSQERPLPNYMLQHREANGVVVQTVVHAVGAPLPAAPAAGKVKPHNYTITVTHGEQQASGSGAAPQSLIHAHAGAETCVKLAKSRASTTDTAYWAPLEGISVPLSLGGVLQVELKQLGANKASYVVQGTVPPQLDAHFARYYKSLDIGLKQHLEQQLVAKGLPNGRRGGVAVVRGFDAKTGTSALLAFALDSVSARLVDVEVHVPAVAAPVPVQRVEHRVATADPRDPVAIGALVRVLEEHATYMERHVESLHRIEAPAATIAQREGELAECQTHLRALTAHRAASGGDASGKVPVQVRSAVKYVTQDLDHIAGKTAFSLKTRQSANDFLAKFVAASATDDDAAMLNIQKTVNDTGSAMMKLASQISGVRNAREKETGKFKTALSGKFTLGTLISDFDNKRDEMGKWREAALLYMAAYIANRCATKADTVEGKRADVFSKTALKIEEYMRIQI